ncbi:unnamed protein product [Cylicocyclus nassatus]|uniref:Box C/D snoRNA protein 1 n=1 Tax=Cylicocyclus nassatus TaxID=53992 RepID=A0AA36DNN6_CYLNA|nr:unnamed protein product [Cylicocyclus nassatus]
MHADPKINSCCRVMSTDVSFHPDGGGCQLRGDDESNAMEDGEIVEAEDTSFIPLVTNQATLGETNDELSNSSDDEPPEEILNRVAKKKAEEEQALTAQVIDPKLCAMCQKVPHKYRCPKCDLRTCSVDCSKKHKEERDCDGVRPPFEPVSKLSQFDANKSIQDQRFLSAVQSNIKKSPVNASLPSTSNGHHSDMISEGVRMLESVHHDMETMCERRDDNEENADGSRFKANSVKERYLIQNALRRRIWLSYSDDKGGEDSSRHEQFSDTIFWCVDLNFTKQLEDGTISTYTYRVQNIPETIRLVTILRQFLKPRIHGCIVSRSDLDLEKLSPFIEAGIESVNAFMRVPNFEPERYYLIDIQKDLLHNTRNRVIIDHPKIIITLDTEFVTSYNLISEAEAEEIREKQRQSRAMAQAADRCNGFDGPRGGYRGNRGGFRGRGAPRGHRGGFHEQNDYGNRGHRGRPWGRGDHHGKRSWDREGDDGYHNKRGRGGRGGDRGPPRSYGFRLYHKRNFMGLSERDPVKSEFTSRAGGDLPVHIRNLMQEIVNDELGARREDVLPSAVSMETDEPITSAAATDSTTERERIPRKLSKTMDALLGHANVIYARGNTKEALAVLLEVIRQEPRNAASYRQVSDIYQELGDYQKSLQYGLLAAHLDPRTPAEDWAHWGDESKKLELIEEAAACYGRDLRPLAMRTRLQAAQMINPSQAGVDFEWFHELIKTVAQYYITINDEDRAILALEAFVLRSKEFGRSADTQHETLIGMWIAKNKFTEAAKSIFALCDGITVTNKMDGSPAMSISLSHGTYSVEPFPPKGEVEFHVEDSFSTRTLSRLIVCFIGLGKRDLANPLKAVLLKRNLSNHEDEPYVLEIARAFYNCDAFKTTKALKDVPTAMESFEKVLQINPGHVDARINLSGLQQKMGQSDRALETLQDYDLDTCTHLPDERLLIRQTDVLFDSQKTEQFIRTCRMLLTPYFYEVHRSQESVGRRRSTKTGFFLSNTLRVAAMNAITNTNWEKFVRRLGAAAFSERRGVDDMDPALMHDYCLRLIECLLSAKRYQDMLVVCCYAFLQPRITKSEKSSTFQNLLYFCAIKAQSWSVAFEYVRWFHSLTNTAYQLTLPNTREVLSRRIFNAMNYVFVHSQNVCYHRYIMRSLAKSPGNYALQIISGNNSLITGTYRHALGEYLRVWNQNKNNPLVCLLLALTFTHMSCKKDLSSRHMIAIRGVAFMKLYEKNRNCRQEVYYNIARMFHQMSITPIAIYFYEKVLAEPPPVVYHVDEEGNEVLRPESMYDMRRFAAHNLALMYRASGNDYLARKMYEKYLVV